MAAAGRPGAGPVVAGRPAAPSRLTLSVVLAARGRGPAVVVDPPRRRSVTTPQLCACSGKHSPPITAAEIDVHHVPPSSFPLAPDGVRLTVRICVCCHRRCHRLLNLYVHARGTPPRSVLAQFRPLERELAAYAWANADHTRPGHLPYTLSEAP